MAHRHFLTHTLFHINTHTHTQTICTYTDYSLRGAAVRYGLVEADERGQGLGHPVGHHGHGAEHCSNLQHGHAHLSSLARSADATTDRSPTNRQKKK